MESPKKYTSVRFHYLDSIRGIAALMVVFYHYIGWKWSETLSYKLGAFIFNGSDAVSFFFVLSGFVLSYPYLQLDRKYSAFNYVRGRILRLYPAYIFTILVTAFYHYRNNLSFDTLKAVFIHNQEPRIWNELAMVLHNHDFYLPGWTLRIEMIYSLIIPLLVILVLKKKQLIPLVFILCFFIGDPNTRLYMTHFIYGLGLAYVYPRLAALNFSETKFFKYRYLIYLLIFVLFSFRNWRYFIPAVEELFHKFWVIHIRWEHFSGIAAFIILLLVIMSKNAQRFLENPVLLFLGKISYSIYLIHWVLVLVVMEHWDKWAAVLGDGYLRFFGMLAILLTITILCATIMYKYIEQPFIKLNRRLRSKGT